VEGLVAVQVADFPTAELESELPAVAGGLLRRPAMT